MLLPRHLQRLAASAEYFAYAFSRAACRRALRAAAGQFTRAPRRVRLLLSRQGRARVESALLDQVAAPSARAPRFVRRVALAEQPVDSQDRFLYHKTTRREVYDRALRRRPDCDDVILWNERGEITESCVANIVVVRGKRWLTPPVSCGLLPGTYRAHLLAQGKLQEAVLTKHDVQRADRILLINSVRGVMEAEIQRAGKDEAEAHEQATAEASGNAR